MLSKGVIKYRQRSEQIKDYGGMLFGNITPTDIDGLIEYHGKGYIIIELKLRDTPLAYGQRLALERLTDDLNGAGKATICIIAGHNIDNPTEDIDVANAIVREYKFREKWQVPNSQYNIKHFIENFIKSLDSTTA